MIKILKFRNGAQPFVRYFFKSLEAHEIRAFSIQSLLRVPLVILDVAGVLSLGLWVSALTRGTSFTSVSVWIDRISQMLSMDAKLFLGCATIFFFTIKGILAISLNNKMAALAGKIESRVSGDYLNKLLASGLEGLDEFPKSKLSAALVDSTKNAFGLGTIAISIIIGEIVLILGISLVLVFTNWLLFSLFLILFTALGLALTKSIGQRISEASRQSEYFRNQTSSLIQDIQINIRQIIAMNRVEQFSQRFTFLRRSMAVPGAKVGALTSLPRYAIEFGLAASMGLLLIPSFVSFDLGLDLQTLTIFAGGLFKLISALMPLQNQLNLIAELESASHEARRVDSLFVEGFGSNKREASITHQKKRPDLLIKNLTFKYANEFGNVFEGLSVEIPFGSLVAVEGASGTGKSTFVDVLLGIRQASSGTIEFSEGPDKLVRNEISFGYVPQKTELISGTVLENIVLGFYSDEQQKNLTRTIAQSGLTEFVNGLPEGLSTRIDRFASFSGGEIQRIGLARALVHLPDILVIDEGTSALDAGNAREIAKTISMLRGTTTIFLISHKISELSDADIRIKFPFGLESER